MLRDCGLPQVSTRSPSPDKPSQRLAPRAERRAEAHHLGKAARDQRGMRAGAEFLAGDDAGGDGIDILHRAADLRADHVVAPIAAERRMAERVGKVAAERFLRRCQRHRSGQPARDLGGEARPRQHGDLGGGQGLRHDLRHQSCRSSARCPSSRSPAAGRPSHKGASSPATARSCCAGATISKRSQLATSLNFAVASIAGSRLTPGQIDAVAMRLVDVGRGSRAS